jgi:serine/threonine protein phosphatase PrpC
MNRKVRLEAYGSSVRGGRASNEDAFVLLDARHPIVRARRRGSLYAVADGLGGHPGGAEAARVAVETLPQFFDSVREPNGGGMVGLLQNVVEEAHRRVRERAAENPALEGLGTTLTAALFHAGRVYFVHTGDSRLYRVRRGRLDLLTDDQTVAFQLHRAGRLTDSEYRTSPLRHALVSYLGADAPSLQVGEADCRPHDRFLLVTDGVLKSRRDSSLLRASEPPRTTREWIDGLLSHAASNPDSDNATAIGVFLAED